MKKLYFNCEKKGKVLALVFNDAKDINSENLKHLIGCDSDRYIKIILAKDGLMACQTAIKFELDNEQIVSNRAKLVENDLIDLRKIRDFILVEK